MISKELLSLVLGINIKRVINLSSANKVHYDGERGMDTINIYELAYKCKEWARNKGYILFSSVTKSLKGICLIKTPNGTPYPYRATTEPETVYKACQWILDNKHMKESKETR